jgi:hypothetical protein
LENVESSMVLFELGFLPFFYWPDFLLLS